MNVLHLIIHKGMVSKFPEKNDLDLLSRIKEIEDTQSDVKYVPWLGVDHPASYDYAYWILPILEKKDYDLVMLYGVARESCVKRASKFIIEAGVPVAYDIEGTA